jgi:hypothetical protein
VELGHHQAAGAREVDLLLSVGCGYPA